MKAVKITDEAYARAAQHAQLEGLHISQIVSLAIEQIDEGRDPAPAPKPAPEPEGDVVTVPVTDRLRDQLFRIGSVKGAPTQAEIADAVRELVDLCSNKNVASELRSIRIISSNSRAFSNAMARRAAAGREAEQESLQARPARLGDDARALDPELERLDRQWHR